MSTLEKLTDRQLAPLLAESEHAFLPAKDHPKETATSLIEKFKHDRSYTARGYVINGKAVSYVIALSGRADSEIAIGPMYVAEGLRGNGLGKRQIMEFIRLYAEQGYTSIYTKTWLNNTASRHSFESSRFIEVSRKDNDRINGDSTISYTLHIDRP